MGRTWRGEDRNKNKIKSYKNWRKQRSKRSTSTEDEEKRNTKEKEGGYE